MMVSREHRAFTLIEVLLAAFILGLGVLGLLALFAGAARQQQVSSQTTRAFFAAGNAEALLGSAFGAISGNAACLTQDVWYRLPIDAQHYYLRLAVQGCGSLHFQVDPTVPLPARMFQQAQAIDCTIVPDPGFSGGAPDGPYDTPNWDFTFADRRLAPDTIRIDVTISRCEDPDGDGMYDRQPGVVLSFFRRPGVTYQYDRNHSSSTSGLWLLPWDGRQDHDPENTGSFVPVEAMNYIVVDVQPSANGTSPARITDLHIGDIRDTTQDPIPPSPEPWKGGQVLDISAAAYKWNADQLVSLNDRLTMRNDPSAPGGRRPEQCYSVMFRRTATATEAVVAAYGLTPASSSPATALPEETPWWFIPPETQNDVEANRGPIRLVFLSLRYDRDVDQYYFRTTNENEQWAVQPGQWLLVEGVPGTTNNPGSDHPVKVVRLVRETADQGRGWRGYLNEVPRANRQAMLPRPLAEGGLAVNLRVFAVADTVVSRADGSVWRLAPLGTTHFRASLGQ